VPSGIYIRTKRWTRTIKPLSERFWQKVDKLGLDECWAWLGAKDKYGYGRIGRGGLGHRSKTELAHRVSWELHNGTIEDNLFVCHSCDNPNCCNPNHLFLGTQFDNMKDAASKERVKRGTAHHNVKLSPEKVKIIRESSIQNIRLSKEFGVDASVISEIKNGKAWTHV
jgi:hypothetical protein